MDTTFARPDPFVASYLDATCLVDSTESMGQEDLPLYLMHETRLFIIQAASSNSIHKYWTSRRPVIHEFLLNPPEEDEMIQASGLFSLFSTDTDWS